MKVCESWPWSAGFEISNLHRRTNLNEMMRLQGMSPSSFLQAVSNAKLGEQVGNSMSINILDRLFVKVLNGTGLAHGLVDPWTNGSALEELSSGSKRRRLAFVA